MSSIITCTRTMILVAVCRVDNFHFSVKWTDSRP